MEVPETTPFKEVHIPQQKVVDGVLFPLVLSPESSAATSLAEAVRAHKPWVEDRLHEAGAILFRGFHNPTASEFSDVVEGFGSDDVPFMAGAAPRKHVVGRIFTANDGPPHLTLHFHNEMAYVRFILSCNEFEKCLRNVSLICVHIFVERSE